MWRALVQILQLESSAHWLDRLLPKQDLQAVLRQHFRTRFSGAERQRIASAAPRVFIAVKHHNWEQAGLVDSWADVAETVPWDWGDRYDQHSADWHAVGKRAFNEELYQRVAAAHAKRPLTHFFSYLSGRWLYPRTIERIGDLGIVTINFSFDDSHRFWGKRREGIWTGIATIARAYDLNITAQDPADVIKYRLSGARALYLPPGGNPSTFADLPKVSKRYFASFVGQCYGVRREYIDYLRKHGIDVHTWGMGWPEGPVSHPEMLEIYAASHVILGFGFVGSSRRRTAVKGRDFEIPLTGTAYADLFEEGREILFYKTPQDACRLLAQMTGAEYQLAHIGSQGKARALREHTWSRRWEHLLNKIGEALAPP